MDVAQILSQMGGVGSIARELGLTESQAVRGAEALLPAILGGFKKQAAPASAGLSGLQSLAGQLGGAGLLDEVLSPRPTDVSLGNSILGTVFGTREVSRAVAQNASAKSGLDASVLRKMLPILAMLVTGYIARQSAGGTAASAAPRAGGVLTGLAGGLLGSRRGKAGTAAPAVGLGGLLGMLDMNGDGNPLDDILGMVK